jgi:hypothetical protein
LRGGEQAFGVNGAAHRRHRDRRADVGEHVVVAPAPGNGQRPALRAVDLDLEHEAGIIFEIAAEHAGKLEIVRREVLGFRGFDVLETAAEPGHCARHCPAGGVGEPFEIADNAVRPAAQAEIVVDQRRLGLVERRRVAIGGLFGETPGNLIDGAPASQQQAAGVEFAFDQAAPPHRDLRRRAGRAAARWRCAAFRAPVSWSSRPRKARGRQN